MLPTGFRTFHFVSFRFFTFFSFLFFFFCFVSFLTILFSFFCVSFFFVSFCYFSPCFLFVFFFFPFLFVFFSFLSLQVPWHYRQFSWLPTELPAVAILENSGMLTELPTISKVVGRLIRMANFLLVAHGQPTPLPTELPTFLYLEVVGCPPSCLLLPYM